MSQQAHVRGETLILPNGQLLALGSAEWLAWLDSASSFRYEGQACSFSARSERFQRGGHYWRAYRRVAGKLRRVYLGRDADLSSIRLEQAAQSLATAAASAQQARSAKAKPAQLPLLESKLRPPSLRRTSIERPALLKRLAAAAEHRLLLLTTPPGWGKTTALAQWSQHDQSIQSVWLALDQGDNDPLRFWSYLLTGLARIAPALLHTISMLQISRPLRIEQILTQLINTLMASNTADIALILDDYHLITEPSIHTGLTQLIDQLPAHLHLVLSSRSEPPLPLTRWRASGYIAELRTAELRFSQHDGAALLAEVLGTPLAQDQALALIERTEGWAAGLYLAGLALRSEPNPATANSTSLLAASRSASHPFILNYLIEEIVRQQPADMQDFLLKTCILEKMCASICAELCAHNPPATQSERGLAQARLDSLERANVFVTVLDEQRKWFRYHQLFADALRAHARQSNPKDYVELHRKAMGWYQRQIAAGQLTQIDPVIEHALAAGLHADAVALLAEHAENMIWKHGEVHTLLRWMSAIPREALDKQPQLALLEAWALLGTIKLDELEARLRDIARRYDTSVAAELAAIRSFIVRIHGDYAGTIDLAFMALERLPEQHAIPRYLAAVNLINAYMIIGEIHKAQDILERVRDAIRDWTIPPVLVELAGIPFFDALLLFMRGQVQQAKRLLINHISTQKSQSQGIGQGTISGFMAELCYVLGDIDEAERWAQRALEQGQQAWNTDSLSQASYILGRITRLRGDQQAAAALFARSRQFGLEHNVPNITRSVELLAVWEALENGDPAPAAQLLAQRDLHEHDQFTSTEFEEYDLLARVALAEQRWQSAISIAERLRSIANAGGYIIRSIAAERLLALAHAGAGHDSEAHSFIHKVLNQSFESGMIQPIIEDGEPMRALLLAHARIPGHRLDYQRSLRRLLQRFPMPNNIDSRSSNEDALLTQREREVLRLLRSGRSNSQIATEMVVTIATVKKHLSSIFSKLGARSRAELIARMRE